MSSPLTYFGIHYFVIYITKQCFVYMAFGHGCLLKPSCFLFKQLGKSIS
jgi:hypothetical protein